MIVFQLFKVEIKNGATMPSQRNTKNLSFFPWFKFSRSSILASGFWLKGFGGFRKEMEKGGLCRLWDDRNCTKPSLPYQRLRLIKRILRLIPVISVGTDTCGRIFPSLQFKYFTGGLGWLAFLARAEDNWKKSYRSCRCKYYDANTLIKIVLRKRALVDKFNSHKMIGAVPSMRSEQKYPCALKWLRNLWRKRPLMWFIIRSIIWQKAYCGMLCLQFNYISWPNVTKYCYLNLAPIKCASLFK